MNKNKGKRFDGLVVLPIKAEGRFLLANEVLKRSRLIGHVGEYLYEALDFGITSHLFDRIRRD